MHSFVCNSSLFMSVFKRRQKETDLNNSTVESLKKNDNFSYSLHIYLIKKYFSSNFV